MEDTRIPNQSLQYTSRRRRYFGRSRKLDTL